MGYEPRTISSFHNLQDASGPSKTLVRNVKESLLDSKRTANEYRACVDAEQLWKRSDPSGADLTGSLEAASRQRLKSPLVEHNYRL